MTTMKTIGAAMHSALLSLAILGLAGCASSPKSKFYVFPPVLDPAPGAYMDLTQAEMKVGCLPVTIAAYLDRPQIVSRISEEQIRIDEFNRWGTPLENSVLSVLGGTLAGVLDKAYVDVFPWAGKTGFDYQVQVEVIRLDGIVGKQADLIAQWTLVSGKDPRNPLIRRTTVYRKDLTGKDYSDYVNGLRAVLTELGRDIAKAILADHEAGSSGQKPKADSE